MQRKLNHKALLWLAILLFIALYAFIRFGKHHTNRETTPSNLQETRVISPLDTLPPATYTARQFNLVGTMKGLSKKQIEEHEALYKGYVKQRNIIAETLKTVDRSNLNRTYSAFRGLKIAETYAVNGQILHELYFENLGGKGSVIGEKMQELIDNNFGSLEAFKQDLIDCGNIARGWVITAYSLDDHRVHNFVLEEHNQHVPILIVPLIVLDVYEHAYMIDYGIARNPYLDVFWNNINWDVVEKRINTWIR